MLAGIDYGCGQTNVDHKTGIRFGVISQGSVLQAWCDSAEADYGEPICPKCGNTASNSADLPEESEEWGIAQGACSDYGCKRCEYVFDACEAFGDEPQGWHYEGDGYECVDCLDSDIMILKSPYYTKAVFCSPCVPGACSIESPDSDGAKAYCFGHDWFEDGKAPYPVYRVDNDNLVTAKLTEEDKSEIQRQWLDNEGV
jgi:hypothetical protein